jgi:hypothetical protein
MKIGPDEGNMAIIRWGKHLDNGIWIRTWKFRRLWSRWKFKRGYVCFGIVVLHYNNV